ncbi:zinc finger CCCH domain-containing protein [Trifolium repens]|nr:zinc finger CCCH domain-containing protein [Trifolium repens]
MREKASERGSEGGKHGFGKHGHGNSNKHPEVIGYRNQIERTTSFFITNFPEESTAEDLWNIFRKYWKVGEVYIPNKLDKGGKRFGFARFEDVEDKQKLLHKLEDTWIGSYKLRANLPKFRRGEEFRKPIDSGGELGGTTGVEARVQAKGQTFKEAVQGVKKTTMLNQFAWKAKPKIKSKSRLTDEEYRAGIMAIDAEPENLKRLEGCFVGILRNMVDADSIQVTLWMEGFQNIKAAQLGLDLILLSSPDKEAIQQAYQANKDWWERWFSTVKPWRPDILPKGRRIWVRLFGVPLHIWSFEGFKKIIWRYGNLLKLDPDTMEQSRLDVARAQIAVTYWEMVDEVIEIKVDDEIFIIRMVEERFGGVDVGVDKVACSRTGVGESDCDSVSTAQDGRSVLGIEEGWSENHSDGGMSVNEACNQIGVVGGEDDSVGIIQRLETKAVSGVEVRDGVVEKVIEKVGTKGGVTEESEMEVDSFQGRVGEIGSEASAVMETPQHREQALVLESQEVLPALVVDEKERLVEDFQQVLVGEVLVNGLDTLIGPPVGLGQREGKEIMIVDDTSNKLLKGGNSNWAMCNNSPMVQRVIEENNILSEDYETSEEGGVETVGQQILGVTAVEGKRKLKEGCKKLPLFFGPNKWVQYTNAKKIHGGKKGKKIKGANKKKKKGAGAVEVSQEDEIQMETSESTGESGCCGDMAKQLIPVSNIQIVLNEGEVCRTNEGHSRQIRVEAERLFHIGLNLGITSNEDRLLTLDRMVDLEVGDEEKFEANGGEEVLR